MDFAQAAEILGLKGGEFPSDIKKKYKKFVLKYHPDRYQSESAKKQAEKRLKEINEAYQYIMDNADECFDTTARKKTTQNPLQFDDDFYWRKDEIYKILYEFEEMQKNRKNKPCNVVKKDYDYEINVYSFDEEKDNYDFYEEENYYDEDADLDDYQSDWDDYDDSDDYKDYYDDEMPQTIYEENIIRKSKTEKFLEILGTIILGIFYLFLKAINKELDKE